MPLLSALLLEDLFELLVLLIDLSYNVVFIIDNVTLVLNLLLLACMSLGHILQLAEDLCQAWLHQIFLDAFNIDFEVHANLVKLLAEDFRV